MKQEVFKYKLKVSDNWYPTYNDGTVEVIYNRRTKRMSFWGDDDFGMIKENVEMDEHRKIVRMNKVFNKEMLKAMGFSDRLAQGILA